MRECGLWKIKTLWKAAVPALLVTVPLVAPAQESATEPAAVTEAAAPTIAETDSEAGKSPAHRLAEARSPYLRAHADNLVEWRQWTPEALAEARDQNKPIYLSIGYSACYWCHVMERESFLDPEIAALINENFLPIKVDREERPDIDHLYMQIYQAMSGSAGGWPLNLWLGPDLTPFYGATYLPPETLPELPSFPDVLRQVIAVWKEDPELVEDQNERMREIFRQLHQLEDKAHVLDLDILTTAANELAAGYDMTYGGLGGAPKFPQPLQLEFLLTQWHRSGDPFYKEMVVETARAMARGGIYDHVGGGFHRYTVDEEWKVPHFEKMLFTNALLGKLYARVWQVTGEEAYSWVARDTLDALLRDFVTTAGGFATAFDATSGGQEGGFYTWIPEEIELAFASRDDGDALKAVFHKDFELVPVAVKDGETSIERSVIRRKRGSAGALSAEAARAREVLARVQAERPAPSRDDKVLTNVNGLAISALAEAGAILDEPRYTQAAVRAAEFVLTRNRREDRLVHYSINGEAGEEVFLDDYAGLTRGCLSLYETTGDERWIKFANLLALEMIELFWDEEQDAFFYTIAEPDDLPVRPLDLQDESMPSGNSLATWVVARLGFLLDNDRFTRISRESCQATLAAFPRNYELVPVILDTVYFLEGGPPEIAIVGDPEDEAMREIVNLVQQTFVPGKVVAIEYVAGDSDSDGGETGEEHPVVLLRGKTSVDGQPALYICRNYTCREPLTDLAAVREAVQELAQPASGRVKTSEHP